MIEVYEAVRESFAFFVLKICTFGLNIYVKNEQLLLFVIIFLIVSKLFIKHIAG